MRFWILIFLYAVIVIYYASQTPRTPFSKWPLLPKHAETSSPDTCTHTSDCKKHDICVNNLCVPQLLRGEDCYPETGTWTLVSHRGKSFAACICLNPNLVTQTHFGGNCTVDVACRPNGYFSIQLQKCICAEGFVPTKNFECQKMSVVDRMKYYPCEPDELSGHQLNESDGLDKNYIRRHYEKKCFKRPCTFDAITGKPLKKARYKSGFGCVCDPTLGQFGVRIEELDDYTYGKGYNACVSAFKNPPEEPMDVQLYAYFYLLDHNPVTFLHYSNVDPKKVIAPLRDQVRDGSLQIGQEFPFDYMQVFFLEKESFKAKIYNYRVSSSWFGKLKMESSLQPNRMEWCRWITRHWQPGSTPLVWKNQLMYAFPACYIGKNDLGVPEKYRGTIVSNPHHVTLPGWPESPRSNGLLLKHEGGDWTLELAPDYKLETYSQVTDNVPKWDDPLVEALKNRKVTRRAVTAGHEAYEKTKSDRENEPFF